MHMIVLFYHYVPILQLPFAILYTSENKDCCFTLFQELHPLEIINITKNLLVPWDDAPSTVTEISFAVSKTCSCTQKEGSI